MLGFAAWVGKGREEGGLGRRGVWADRRIELEGAVWGCVVW